ncbi:unnamed protein product [Urochloa decumbens]|uniref:DUF569 domain-containing protein n=1 Tax=Urochloa decumbens TaxID=240449 RepID=A0ABC9BQU2_9POAL
MEVFEGAEFVRLRSLEHGTYLHAAEDGRGVLLDPRGASPHAAWAVQPEHSASVRGGGGAVPRRGTARFLLRGVYGRYLGAADPGGGGPLLLLHPCRRLAAAQRDRGDNREAARAIMWRAVATASGAGVVLLHDAHGRFLRANTRRLPCRAGVSVGDGGSTGPTMKWAVEVIPSKHGRPELPLAADSDWIKFLDGACPPMAGICRWAAAASQQREIRWVLAGGAGGGDIREGDWASFQYSGRSAILMRSKLAHLTRQFRGLTLFIRAGRHGQLAPLVTDLPRSRERLDIVVVRDDTLAADQLIFPDVDKETEEPAKEGVLL